MADIDGLARHQKSRLDAALVGLCILISALIGAIPVLLPGSLPFLTGVIVSMGVFYLIVIARSRMASRRVFTQAIELPAGEMKSTLAPGEAKALPIARFFYYGGIATVAQLSIEGPLRLSLSDCFLLVALALAICTLLDMRRAEHIRLPVSLVIGSGVYGAGALLSSIQANRPLESLFVAARVVLVLIVLAWLSTHLLRTARHVQIAVGLWAFSSAVTGMGAFAQWLFGDVIPGTSPVFGRMTGFTPHMNQLGGVSALALAPCAYLITGGARRQRIFALFLLPFICGGLLLSGSIGALLAALVAAVVWIFAARRILVPLTVLACIFVAAVVAQGLLSSGSSGILLWKRIESVVEGRNAGDGLVASRIESYEDALNTIARNPLIGQGLDDLSSRTNVPGPEALSDGRVVIVFHQVHNLLLATWYEAGLLGMVGLMVVLMATLWAGICNILSAPTVMQRHLAVALLAAYASFFFFSMGHIVTVQRYAWLPGALALALRTAEPISQGPHDG